MTASHRIRIVSFLASIVLLGLVCAGASPAAAHDELLRTTPTNGATLQAPPTEVTLTFSAEQLPGAAKLIATADSGARVPLTDVQVNATVVTGRWPAGQPAGTYIVGWRSAGSDGHVLDGSFSFSYRTPNAGPTAASPTGSPDISILTPAPAAQTTSTSFPWWLVGLAVVVVIGVIIAIVTVRRGRHSTPDA